MPPSRAWRRLLLVCFMLCTWGGQEMREHQTLPGRLSIPALARALLLQTQCHFPTKLFATHHLTHLALTTTQ